MNKKKTAEAIENKIWEAIQDLSDPESFEWRVSFLHKGEMITIDNTTLIKKGVSK